MPLNEKVCVCVCVCACVCVCVTKRFVKWTNTDGVSDLTHSVTVSSVAELAGVHHHHQLLQYSTVRMCSLMKRSESTV